MTFPFYFPPHQSHILPRTELDITMIILTAFLSCTSFVSGRNSLSHAERDEQNAVNVLIFFLTESDLHTQHTLLYSIHTSNLTVRRTTITFKCLYGRYNNWRYSRIHRISWPEQFFHFSSEIIIIIKKNRASKKGPSSRLTQQLPREVIMLVHRSASARCISRYYIHVQTGRALQHFASSPFRTMMRPQSLSGFVFRVIRSSTSRSRTADCVRQTKDV